MISCTICEAKLQDPCVAEETGYCPIFRCSGETAAAIRAEVRTWPPLTERQKARLSVLLHAPIPTSPAGEDG